MSGRRGGRRALRVAPRGRHSRAVVAVVAGTLPLVFGVLAWAGAGLGDRTVAEAPAGPGAEGTERLPVDRVTLLCPREGATDEVLVGRPDLGAEQAPEAEVRVGEPGEPGESLELSLGAVARPDGRGPVAVRVEGAGAPALFADVSADTGDLAAARCVGPAARWWFTGAGAGVGHRSALSLTNLDPGPAVVDVRLYAADGPVSVESLRGVTISPAETRTWSWADVVPGEEDLTVEVRAVRGRVAATSLEEGEGADWAAPAAPPATRHQVPAVPAGPGRTRLTVTNPGVEPGLVTVRVVTATGAFVPLGLEETPVDPGTVTSIDLTAAVRGEAAAVEVTADAAVVVGVRKTLRPAGDVASIPGAPPLVGAGAAAAGPGRTVLHLSGGDAPVAADVRAVGDDGELLAEERLTVRRSGLVTWTAPSRTAYVVVVPDRGTPFAAVVRSGRTGGVAVVPVTDLPWERRLPAVRPQPAS